MCTSKSKNAFNDIWFHRRRSCWSLNGLVVDFRVSTFWSEKTLFFVLAWQNHFKLSRKLRCDAEIHRTFRLTYSSSDTKVDDLETVWLLTFCVNHGRMHKPAFSILDFPSKISSSCAKNCTVTLKIFMRVVYYMIRNSWKRRVLKWRGSQLLVDTSSEAPYTTNPGCAYTIWNNVAARHATEPKIAVRLVWYIINTPSKLKLLKRLGAWAVSLARLGTFLHGAICWIYFCFLWTWPYFRWWKRTV